MGLNTLLIYKINKSYLKYWTILISILCIFAIPVPNATAQGSGDLCFENVDDLCGAGSGDAETVFKSIIEPLESQIGFGVATGFGFVVFWAGIMAIIWFKTENIMLLGLIGVFVNATIVSFNEQAQGIGILLLGVANGLLLFQMLRQRVSLFS